MLNKPESIIRILLVLCIIQVVFSVLFAIKIFLTTSAKSPMDNAAEVSDYDYKDLNPNENELVIDGVDKGSDDNWLMKKIHDEAHHTTFPVVEIWGKAAIGMYLWEHIFNSSSISDPLIPGTNIGQKNYSSLQFIYREGPGLVPSTVPLNVENLILVINGRTQAKINSSLIWLEYLKTLENPPKTIIVMLGNEKCENDWISSFVESSKFIKAVFLTYDDPIIDNEFYFQWPLGVATYRSFPNLERELLHIERKRKYVCNFQATVHEGSSRVKLLKYLQDKNDVCLVKPRNQWLPNESTSSMNKYIGSLIQSDITLCPSGFNAETYRVYESMAAGSVPVIEYSSGHGRCDSNPWRLLKKYKPPVLWVKNWDAIDSVLKYNKKQSLSLKVRSRRRIHRWYESFKVKIKDNFIAVLKEKFQL